MLDDEIPDDVPAETASILRERYPNYCEACGSPLSLAGGWQRLTPSQGLWYDHIDAVLMCGDCGDKRMHMSGIDREEGLAYYQDGTDGYHDEFSDVSGYCEHHGLMTVTKDIQAADGTPLRQWKCEECDRGMAVAYTPDDG